MACITVSARRPAPLVAATTTTYSLLPGGLAGAVLSASHGLSKSGAAMNVSAPAASTANRSASAPPARVYPCTASPGSASTAATVPTAATFSATSKRAALRMVGPWLSSSIGTVTGAATTVATAPAPLVLKALTCTW